jgi:hypothetical protein
MKTEVWVSFNYGGWSLIFLKEFDLPFTPFYGMSLLDELDYSENDIRFVTNDYCETIITYNAKHKKFVVDVHNRWKWAVTDETIDDTLKQFLNTNWERKDRTDISELKELMNRNKDK